MKPPIVPLLAAVLLASGCVHRFPPRPQLTQYDITETRSYDCPHAKSGDPEDRCADPPRGPAE